MGIKRIKLKKRCKCGCDEITKLSCTGKRYNNYIKGHYAQTESHRKISSSTHKGKVVSLETRRKISLSRGEKYSGVNHPMHGRKCSEKAKEKMRLTQRKNKKIWGKNNFMFGKNHLEETKRKMSLSLKKRFANIENHPSWQGGKSFEPYGLDWTETLKKSIRQRDDYTCKLCGIKQGKEKHSVHHIDYDKENNGPINLITLCRKCHLKTNYDRGQWVKFFNKFINSNLKVINVK